MVRSVISAIVLVIMLGGCGESTAPATSGAPSVAPSTSVPAGSEAPSVAPVAPLDFSWPDGDRPAVSRELAGTDEAYINPGAVIEHDGVLHMFANVFTAWPGRVEVRHLESPDGVAWELAEPEPIFTSDDVAVANPGIDVSTGFVRADGSWVLLFETVSRFDPWVIGMATAPGPDGPWTIAPDPVVRAGAEGSADAAGLPWPSVVATADGLAMYYTAAASQARAGSIARATSVDGVTWVKDAEPVLVAEAGWEGAGLDRPRVVAVPDGFVMVYAAATLTDRGVATSPDGVTWKRAGDSPAITADDFPINGRAWDAALIQRDGTLTYYLEIGTATQTVGTDIYRATAAVP